MVLNTDVSARLDIIARRGDTFSQFMDFFINDVPEDLSTLDFTMQVKEGYDIDPAVISLSIGSGLTLIAGETSTINRLKIVIDNPTMSDLAAKQYIYDVQAKSTTNVVQTRLFGNFTIINDVTTP